MSKIKNFKYYYARGGIKFYILRKMYEKGIISEERLLLTKANTRFNKYFEELPEEDYEKELRAQFDSILDWCGVKYKDNPETFNEKIQWLKVHDTTPLKTRLVDKYLVREWIAEKIGEQYLIPLVGGPWQCADEIDFDALPNQFALKANHGSGMNIIVKDKSKLDIAKTKKTCDSWMNNLFGWFGMEAQYFSVPKRIIAEKYMEDESGYELKDYKVFNCDGNPQIIQVDFGRFSEHYRNWYTAAWQLVDGEINYPSCHEHEIPKPDCLDEMLEISRKLSDQFNFARIDFYCIDGRLYFGEMTFTPGNGLMDFRPEDLGREFGSWIKLSENDGGYALKGDGFILVVRGLYDTHLDKTGRHEIGLTDYKIHCFNGEPKIIQVIGQRNFSDHTAKEAFFDLDWNRVDLMYHTYEDYDEKPEKPVFLDELLDISKKLSQGFIYVRVDLYRSNGRTFFGEMTFTPANGTGKWGGKMEWWRQS